MPSKEYKIFNDFRIIINKFYGNYLERNHKISFNYKKHLKDVINATSFPLEFNRSYVANYQPVCRFLDDCLKKATSDTKEISSIPSQISSYLHWQINTNYKGIYSDNFFQNESFVEVIGPSGLLIHSKIRVGFLLLGEEVFYPSHNHEALELYHIISGSSLWQIKEKKFTEKKPGDSSFHDIWVPHAMKTVGEPVLALFSWSGNINKEATPIT